jgi:hypothetical protein
MNDIFLHAHCIGRNHQISCGVRLEWKFFEPFAQRQDLDSRFFLSAIKTEHKLQGFAGSDFSDAAGSCPVRPVAWLPTIERLVRRKYLSWPAEEPEYVLVKTVDVERLSNSNR